MSAERKSTNTRARSGPGASQTPPAPMKPTNPPKAGTRTNASGGTLQLHKTRDELVGESSLPWDDTDTRDIFKHLYSKGYTHRDDQAITTLDDLALVLLRIGSDANSVAEQQREEPELLPRFFGSVTGTKTPRGLKDQRERETGEGARMCTDHVGKVDYEVTLTVKKLGESEVESSRGDRERSRARDGAEPRDESRECAREGANAAEIDSQIEKRALGIVRITRPREIARVEKRCATKTKAFGHESREASKCERPRVESEKWRPKPSNPMRVRAGDTESLPRVRSEVKKKRREKIWRTEEPTSNSLIKDSGLHARKGTDGRNEISTYLCASHTSDVGEGYAENREKGMIKECPGGAALECGDDLHKRIGARP
ncbi:hypothetical protein R3P38DRAFT_2793785 [Favolaschia claudopus]|uniref:Uncharacterized protein n=1 Tax=Favolaschia claudopus TaxID=2862362 RepID=A0AAW0ABS4_9AGAR